MIDQLSPTEREIARLISQGMTAKQIARQRGISPGTVRLQLASIYRKLDYHGPCSAAKLAASYAQYKRKG